jgi:hypothetical protein
VKKFYLIGALGLVLASGTAAPAAITATCGVLANKAIASNLLSPSNNTIFKAMTETTVTFVQGGTAPGCVMVHFSAEVVSGSPVIRAVLDGTTMGQPNEVELDTHNPTNITARSFLFIFTGVAPGRHNVRIEFRGQFAGESTQVRRKNTVVMYTP